jgi:hypothetical protein
VIFEGDHPHLAVAGRKTRLTRPVEHPDETEPYTEGRRYPIQRRRSPTALDADIDRRRGYAIDTLAQVVVSKIERTQLGELDDRAARAEGFANLYLFKEWWREEHGSWAADADVWVVRFELEREGRPRYLARTDAGHGDYTQDPRRAIDDAEVVDEWTQQSFARAAQAANDVLRAEQKAKERSRSLAKRVREEALTNARAGIDVSDELEAIAEQVAAMERKRERAA